MKETVYKNLIARPLLIFVMLSFVFNPLFATMINAADSEEVEEILDKEAGEYNKTGIQDSMEEEAHPDNTPDFKDPYDGPGVDPLINEFKEFYNKSAFSIETPSPVADRNYVSNKIELNASDRRDIERYSRLMNLIPNFENPYSLAEELDRDGGELYSLKKNDHEAFQELADEAFDSYTDSKIIDLAMNNIPVLARILSVSNDYITDKLLTEKAIIEDEIQSIIDTPIDRKIVQTLNYLVRPKDDPKGGAGHWRIKVHRLRRNYSKESTSRSRESLDAERDEAANKAREETNIENIKSRTEPSEVSDLIDNSGLGDSEISVAGEIQDRTDNGEEINITDFLLTDPEESQVISAHFKGQAIDISVVDDFKCTLIEKRRLLSDKKSPTAPRPIKLQWQTNEGYGADRDAIDTSYNDMFLRMSEDAIIQMFAGLDIDFNELGDMSGFDFGEIAGVIGQAFLADAINSPNGNVWKFDLPNLLQKLGGVIVADNLNLDREPFLDASLLDIDGLSEAIGRYAIEKRFNMRYGSLDAENKSQMYKRIGESRILDELRLPGDIFDYETTQKGEEFQGELYQLVGSRIIETELSLPVGSFRTNSLTNVKNSIGSFKIDTLLGFPSSLDNYLNIPDGTTAKLKSGDINVERYNQIVAESHFIAIAFSYPNFNDDGSNRDLKDEMFNLPEGTVTKFLSNTLQETDLKEIGYISVADMLETNDSMRASLTDWLKNPNRSMLVSEYEIDDSDHLVKTGELLQLSRAKYAGALGLHEDDILRIFYDNAPYAAKGVYKSLGERILVEAFKNSGIVQKGMQELQDRSPQLGGLIDTFEFYLDRIDTIKTRSDSFVARSNELEAALGSVQDTSVESINQQMTLTIFRLKSSIDSLKGQSISLDNIGGIVTTIINDIFSSAQQVAAQSTELTNSRYYKDHDVRDISNLVNALNRDVEMIAKSAYEIISGQEQNNFRIEDMSISGMMSGTTGEVVLLLSGQISIKEFLIYHASAKLGNELNLPPMAFKYASAIIEAIVDDDVDIKDAFFRAFGMAKLEESAGISGIRTTLDSKNMGASVTITQIRDGLTGNGGMNRDRANQVILEALGLEGHSLESLMRGDFGAWAPAREKAEKNDVKNKLPIGSTEAFVKSEPMGGFDESSMSDDEVREFATKLGVSEYSVRAFIATRDGDENPSLNKIYYVDNNKYVEYEDTASVCAAKPARDDSYYYFDATGQHVFSSYVVANEYRIAHSNDELDYIGEFSKALTGLKISANYPKSNRQQYESEYKTIVENFVSGNDQSIGDFDNIHLWLTSIRGISSSSMVSKVFAKSNSTVGGKMPIDFLKVYGYSLVEHFAIQYLNGYLGISFGPTRLTADDFFEIFNGNAREVFGRIGGTMLDEELGLTRGTIEEILTARNSDQRRCAMERAAMEMLGELIGIPGLDFDGSLFDNFGGGRIESFLGLPNKSFHGVSLNELADRTGKINFLKAFSIPLPKAANDIADDALKRISSDYYDTHRHKNFYDKAQAIELYIRSMEAEGLAKREELERVWRSVNTMVDQSIAMITDSSSGILWGDNPDLAKNHILEKLLVVPYANYSDKEALVLWEKLRTRAITLDHAFGLNEGATARLLQGATTPNEYRQRVSSQAIESLAKDAAINAILSAFGLENSGITSQTIKEFASDVSLLINGHPFGSRDLPGTPASRIYGFLDKLFSFNLDKKAGFSEGTIEYILVHPDRAMPVVLREGAIRLDGQLGLGGHIGSNGKPHGDGNPSFLKYLSLADVVDVVYGTETDYHVCLGLDYSPTSQYSSMKNCMDTRRKVNKRNIVRSNAANFINQELLKATSFEIDTFDPDGNLILRENSLGVDMPVKDLLGIFDGDMRPFMVYGMAFGLSSILGDENGKLKVDRNLTFDYIDIYYSFYGNPEVEAYARQRAADYAISSANGTNEFSIDYNPLAPPLPRTAQINPSLPNPVTHSSSNAAMTQAHIDHTYPISPDADITPPANPGSFDYGLQPDRNDPQFLNPDGSFNEDAFQIAQNEYNAALSSHDENTRTYLDITELSGELAEEAARKVNEAFTKLVRYQISDCVMYALDQDIPPGFSWAMFEGDSYVRTAYILEFLENKMYAAGFLDFLPVEFRNISLANPFYAFINSDNPEIKGNWTALLSGSGVLDALDSYLVNNGPSIFGDALQAGTAKAIYAFIRTGNISDNFEETIGGTKLEFASLQTIYKDWMRNKITNFADNLLGLPAGTSLQLYEFYRMYKSIKSLQSLTSGIISLTQLQANIALLNLGGAFGAGEASKLAKLEKLQKSFKAFQEAHPEATFKTFKKAQISELKTNLYAAVVSFVIEKLFSKQFAAIEQALGLVPGSLMLLVGMAIEALFGVMQVVTIGGVGVPIALIVFVLMNLFLVYKTELICSPDGSFPYIDPAPDPSKWDVSGIGLFDGMNDTLRDQKYVEVAQYKANRLVGDMYEMPYRTGDEKLVPTQVMTGRQEDVISWAPYINDTVCKKIGGRDRDGDGRCDGTRAGLWQNAQMGSYTHIGF